MRNVVYDLYCGLGGWAQGFLSEGYECIGYDIEKHDYGTGTYPGTLILCDVRSIHGSQLKDATCIVASPPCQEPSYRAMPWKRAKALNAIGPPHNFIELFNACFRIQREASEAAGRYIPMVVENVWGAQQWVGQAQANFGSFYLWGDIGQVGKRIVVRNGPLRFGDGLIARSRGKKQGQDWNRFKELGEVSPHWRMQKTVGHANIRDGYSHTRHLTNQRETDGVKFSQSGDAWFDDTPRDKMLGDKRPAAYGSNSLKRKAASAEIAKIPFPLARYIAQCFKCRRADNSSV